MINRRKFIVESKERILYKNSILDRVSREVDILNKDLSGSDKRKLEDYINSVRDIERRIEMEESLALLTDSTRVVSLVLADEASNRSYPKIEVKESHYELNHHSN